ncbi:NTP transferase domain-containing protein [Glaciecola sp.]|uniref:nucleotidyltransferase family protein n=1 Tax=Glaciecola sp. MF2-115 TaxID=3384827 RepID=UPI003989592A
MINTIKTAQSIGLGHYRIEGLLLAAGEGKRFNGSKQLAMINNKPMLACSAEMLASTDIDSMTIVLGSNAVAIQSMLSNAELTQETRSKMSTIVAGNWQQGMGASIAAGIKKLDKNITHVFIGLADQVAIRQKQCNLMIMKSQENPKKIIAALYSGKLGAPAIFPRTYFAELEKLTNDKGARDILRNNADQVISVAVPNAAKDIDTKAELMSYISNKQQSEL